jgi:hypothetical protein
MSGELQSWYDNGGKEALLYYLMYEVDGDAFDPYAPAPNTTGKSEMAEASRTIAEQFVEDIIKDAEEVQPPGFLTPSSRRSCFPFRDRL